jgi:serpin B
MKHRLLFFLLLAAIPLHAADTDAASRAINTLGIELLAKTDPGGNALLSPYSIQSALAMTYAGADGATRDEMAKVLHYPKDDGEVEQSFVALQRALENAVKDTVGVAAQSKEHGGPSEPMTLSVANRLYGQKGYAFRGPFLALLRDKYGAPLETLDFAKAAAQATGHINGWVEGRTRGRIRDLIPGGALTRDTRLVLVNAVYLKAPWASEFEKSATEPKPFHVDGREKADVPTMENEYYYGYARRDGYSVVSLPYIGDQLQLLLLVPDDVNGLAKVEAKLNAALLADCAKLKERDVDLYLPKFKLQPPTLALAAQLQSLGMKSAFNEPPGSANFDRMAPRKPDDYLYISQVFHKTFLSLDEHGTEAAAATVVDMPVALGIRPAKPKPVELHVDRPFLFAIQDRASGACLFIGRVTDPR